MERYCTLGIARFVPAIKFRRKLSSFTKVFFRKIFSSRMIFSDFSGMELENEHNHKENKNVDQFQEHILQQKPATTKEKNSKQRESVECYIINPLLTKLIRSRELNIGLFLFLRFCGPRLSLGP